MHKRRILPIAAVLLLAFGSPAHAYKEDALLLETKKARMELCGARSEKDLSRYCWDVFDSLVESLLGTQGLRTLLKDHYKNDQGAFASDVRSNIDETVTSVRQKLENLKKEWPPRKK